MYAIVNISGKQFKASEGARVRVPHQKSDIGTELTFDNVLLIHNGTSTIIGTPNVVNASVIATVVNHGRDRKIVVYKKKRRKGYQRKNGHRQWFTELQFQKIKSSVAKTKKASPKKETDVLDNASQEEE